jgi:hypothetical protein
MLRTASGFLKRGVWLVAGAVILGGCVPFWIPIKPAKYAPNGVRLHESWCYRTLAQVECYAKPQDVAPSTLVNVDPPSRYPLTQEDYAKKLAVSR